MKNMKKIFLFLITVILLSSCTYTKVDNSTKIPNVVADTIYKCDSTQINNVYLVETEKFDYYYNEDKELLKKYNVKDNNTSLHYGVLVIIIFFGMFIGYLIRMSDE